MSFIWPAGLAFAALLPLIVILYFLKLHRSPKVVSSTYLWKEALDAYRVNRPFQRFQNHFLLWLQLFLLGVIILALARPLFETEQERTGVHIYLIDHSASMGTAEDGGSRLDLAKEFLRKAVEGKRSSDRMAVVAFSDRAFVAAPMTTGKEPLLRALDQIGPTNRPTNIEDAWWTALSIARQYQASDIYLVSDGGFGPLDQLTQANATVHYVPIGKSVDNVGLVHLETRDSDDGMEIFARVLNQRGERSEVTAELYINDRMVDAKKMIVSPREEMGLVFRRRMRDSGVAEVRITRKDSFPTDNQAWIPLSSNEPVRVLLVGEENLFLRQGLLNNPQVELAVLTPESFEQLKGKLPPNDLVLFDQASPKSLPKGTYVFLGCLPPVEGFSDTGTAEGPVLVNWERDHALTRYVNFSTLHVSKQIEGADPGWMRALLKSDKGTLISAGERGGLRLAVIRFALLDSDWPLPVSFPLFLSNLVRWTRDIDVSSGLVRPGEPLAVAVPPEATKGTLIRPGGIEEPIEAGGARQAVIPDTEKPGIYRVRWENRRADSFYAVNLLDPRESKIVVPPAVTMGDTDVLATDERALVNREFTHFLVWIALVILLGEWLLYQFLKR